MDDVVEQGHGDRTGRRRLRPAGALVVGLALAVLALTRPHLFSADRPAPDRPPPTSPAVRAPNTSQGISVVVRQGDHLERYEAGSGRRPLARLPQGVADPVTLVHVPRGDGTGPLVGVDQTVLFRASPVRGRAVTIIGRALRVLAAAPEPNRVLVLEPFGGPRNGPRLVELDARTGEVTDDRPFPGYDPGGPWRPAELVSSPEASALLLTRPAEGARLDLALAWDRLSVRSEHAPRLVRIGSTDRLLGVAGTRILTGERRQACLEHGCPITVLTVTHDAVLTRAVQPPPGWAYGATMARGDDGDPLVVVAKVGDPSRLALARLVAGGRRGLLVGGTQGMLGSVAPVGGAQGSVVFALPRPEGVRLGVWLPGSRSAALLLDLPALEQGAQLVCACR